MLLILLVSLFLTCHAKEKVHDGVMSDEDHYSHDYEHDHNPQYDHDAFLGKDESTNYNELSPEDSKEKLGKLFPKVDADGDGQVTEDELQKWMRNSQNRYAKQDAADNMKQHDMNSDGHVTWDEYKESAYGFLDKDGVPKDEVDPEIYHKYNAEHNDKEFYAKLIVRDERKYKLADTDSDNTLTQDELAGFLHPETHDHMKGAVALETIEDMDKDNDGLVSLDEYLADMLPVEERGKGKEPDWFQDEKRNFTTSYDANKDGKLDQEEVKNWIFPSDEDYFNSEAKHLISESDANGDGKISKEEMVEKYDTFVGSQATDFGDILQHEEL